MNLNGIHIDSINKFGRESSQHGHHAMYDHPLSCDDLLCDIREKFISLMNLSGEKLSKKEDFARQYVEIIKLKNHQWNVL